METVLRRLSAIEANSDAWYGFSIGTPHDTM